MLLLAACAGKPTGGLGPHAPLVGAQPQAGGAPPLTGQPLGGGGQPALGPVGQLPPAGGGQPQGGGQTANAAVSQGCSGQSTGQDAELMANWVHKEGRFFNYFVPNKDWNAVETTSGIDISSPTGNAVVSFDFLYGAALPASLQQAEATFFQLGSYSGVQIVRQSLVTAGQFGNSQTLEFAAHWNTTGNDVHGCLEVSLSSQLMYGYVRQSVANIWNTTAPTLRLIRDHITYLPANG